MDSQSISMWELVYYLSVKSRQTLLFDPLGCLVNSHVDKLAVQQQCNNEKFLVIRAPAFSGYVYKVLTVKFISHMAKYGHIQKKFHAERVTHTHPSYFFQLLNNSVPSLEAITVFLFLISMPSIPLHWWLTSRELSLDFLFGFYGFFLCFRHNLGFFTW